MNRSHRKRLEGQGIFLNSQAGQVLIEYILILVVSILILLNFVGVFAKPFQSYSSNLLGTYTSCLLETGELPTLNNTSTGECQPPKLDAGTPGSQGLGGGNSSSGNGGGGSKDKNPSIGSIEASSRGSSAGQGGQRRGGGSSQASRYASDGALGKSDKVTEIPLKGADSDSASFFKGNQSAYSSLRSENRKVRLLGLDTLSESQRSKLRNRENLSKKIVSTADETATKVKKVEVKRRIANANLNIENENTTWQLSDWIRYLFIIGIIIIIISLIGGQVAQMMKSWEK